MSIASIKDVFSQLTLVNVNLYPALQKVCTALYDYTAADDDEVGFQENDMIINCEPIDEGWMNGTVERTGESGMLPSNYVEPVNW